MCNDDKHFQSVLISLGELSGRAAPEGGDDKNTDNQLSKLLFKPPSEQPQQILVYPPEVQLLLLLQRRGRKRNER